MSDWQVGDLAACVDAGPRRANGRPTIALATGKIYRISRVRPQEGGSHCHLLLDGEPPHGHRWCGFIGWGSDRFRKIRPDEHKACEEEFQTLLRRSRNRVTA